MQAFSSCDEWRRLSGCGVWASHCGGFSCCGAQALGPGLGSRGSWVYSTDPVVETHGLSCSKTGRWDVPRSGIEPMSPALAGGFFTTEPPGQPNLGRLSKNSLTD